MRWSSKDLEKILKIRGTGKPTDQKERLISLSTH